jgi:poly[(R)-3-hydroxyalkanoate] polymerase subunit PhaC
MPDVSDLRSDYWINLYQSFLNNVDISFQYYNIYNQVFFDTFRKTLNDEGKPLLSDIMNVEKINRLYKNWLKKSDLEIDRLLKTQEFSNLISNHFSLLANLRKNLNQLVPYSDYFHKIYYDVLININSLLSIQKDLEISPFDIEYTNGNVRLLHFENKNKDEDNVNSILIIYATINRFHILDIDNNRSVIGSLLSKGLDVYVLDWGYPRTFVDISIDDYVEYVKQAVNHIQLKNKQNNKKIYNPFDNINNDLNASNKNITKTDVLQACNKISLLGYCWGGVIALLYASIYDKNVKNLTLLATPIDLEKDNTILSTWAKDIDIDNYIDQFGHFDGTIIDMGFVMRNPARNTYDKYASLIQKNKDLKSLKMFISVERWLYDSPIIPGKFLRQMINDFYKNNSLIKNKMKIHNKRVILKDIYMPVLTIVSDNDDLVSAESSLEINNHISSKKKTILRVPGGGHVGLCISKTAHEKIWPKAAEWILSEQ